MMNLTNIQLISGLKAILLIQKKTNQNKKKDFMAKLSQKNQKD